jgi:hypothetical protein
LAVNWSTMCRECSIETAKATVGRPRPSFIQCCDDVADDLRAVDHPGELLLVVLTVGDGDAGQIRSAGGEDPRLDEEVARHQLGRRRARDHGVEEFAEASTVGPNRRGGHADDGAGVAIEDFPPDRGYGEVALVDKDQIRRRQRIPALEGVDRGDVDVEPRLAAGMVPHDDAVIDAQTVEAAGGVLHQFATVDEEQDSGSAGDGPVNHPGGDGSLAAAGGGDQQDALPSGEDLRPDLGYGVGLVVVQLGERGEGGGDQRAPPAAAAASARSARSIRRS